MNKKATRAALAVLLTAILCIAMNAAAFLIDTPTMRENAWQGTAMLCQEGGVPEMVGGFKSSQLDNFTAVLILKTAAYTGPETHLQKTFARTCPQAKGRASGKPSAPMRTAASPPPAASPTRATGTATRCLYACSCA